MSLTVVVPQVTLPAGSHSFGPFAVPVGVSLVGLAFDRSLWSDAALAITLRIELSLDGGVTWNDPASIPFPIGATFVGGVVMDRNNQPVLQSLLGNTQVPGVGNASRMVRAFVTNTLTMTTTVSLVTV